MPTKKIFLKKVSLSTKMDLRLKKKIKNLGKFQTYLEKVLLSASKKKANHTMEMV